MINTAPTILKNNSSHARVLSDALTHVELTWYEKKIEH